MNVDNNTTTSNNDTNVATNTSAVTHRNTKLSWCHHLCQSIEKDKSWTTPTIFLDFVSSSTSDDLYINTLRDRKFPFVQIEETINNYNECR